MKKKIQLMLSFMFFTSSSSLLVGQSISLFLSILLLVSAAVMVYSLFYLSHSNWWKFYHKLLMTFIGVMCMLVISKMGVGFIVWWDLLGVVSFLLVLFYSNWDSYSGSVNTLMANHLGDLFLMLVLSSALLGSPWFFFPLTIFYLVSFTKSPQGVFMSWLPMAMSAPTPISSLVHSSTLVTGGLFLMYYFYYMGGLVGALLVSVSTLFCSGMMSLFEKDMKKLVALSTMSQISLCVVSVVLMELSGSFFQMLTHALFKSTLFIQVGLMIYTSLGSQEARTFPQLILVGLMISSSCLLALCGLLYLSGMFSKDLILLSMPSTLMGSGVAIILLVSISLTFFYSWSLVKALSSSSKPFNGSKMYLFCLFLIFFVLGGGVLAQGFTLFSQYLEGFVPPLFILMSGIFISLTEGSLYSFLHKMLMKMMFKEWGLSVRGLYFLESVLNSLLNLGFLGLNVLSTFLKLSFTPSFMVASSLLLLL